MFVTSSPYSASDFSSKLLCHLCGKMQSKELLVQHMMTCISQCEEPVPYEKTRQMVGYIQTANPESKGAIVGYNNDALDVLIRLNLVNCTNCNKYLLKSIQKTHGKGCNEIPISDGKIEGKTFEVLYKMDELYIRDEETSKRELMKLRNDVLSKTSERKIKILKVEDPSKKVQKPAPKSNNATPKSLIDPSKGLQPRTSMRFTQQVSKVAVSKRVIDDVKASKTTLDISKSVLKDNTISPSLGSRAKSFVHDKNSNPVFQTTNGPERTKSDAISDKQQNLTEVPSQNQFTSTRRINEKKLNTFLSKERNSDIILDHNNFLPIIAQKTKYKSRFEQAVSERDMTFRYTSIGFPTENDRSGQLENRISDNSERRVRTSSVDCDMSEKPRSISPKLQEIKRRSKIEIPENFAQELKRNLSVVSENIKKIEEDRASLVNTLKGKRSVSKTKKLGKSLVNETCEEEEMIRIDSIPTPEKINRQKEIRAINLINSTCEKEIVRNNLMMTEKFSRTLVSCNYCDRTFVTYSLEEHEEVCMKKRIYYQMNP